MICKHLYNGKCNLTGGPCWFAMSATEVCCENYEEDFYGDNPEHERDLRE